MAWPVSFLRIIRTGATFERSGAMKIAMQLFDAPVGLMIFSRALCWPIQLLGVRGDITKPPILRALTALGPAYIKFGQLLSTRPDVVGIKLAKELKVLQDDLPPFSQRVAIKTVETELSIEIKKVFSSFSEPIAAASLAQVHKATLHDTGETVAVKVLRPGVEKAFLTDIRAFYLIARILEIISKPSRRLKPVAVIKHFEGIVREELDLRMEIAAAAEFSANTKSDDSFEVPSVYWELSSRRVMTTKWINGISVGDIEGLKDAGTNLVDFAQFIMQSFLRQALRDGFFHADMHQGNLRRGENGALVVLDFGIMGRIDSYTRRVYAEILMGFLKKDYRRVAEVHFEAGYVPENQDVEAFAQALRSVGEPIFGIEAKQISMARLLAHLFDVTERFGMGTRTELLLLQRTMVVVEGVSRSLDPNMNMWETARPVVETYIKENLGPKALLRDLSNTFKAISRYGPHLPYLIEKSLRSTLDEERRKPQKRRLSAFIGGIALGGVLGAMGTVLAVLYLLISGQ